MGDHEDNNLEEAKKLVSDYQAWQSPRIATELVKFLHKNRREYWEGIKFDILKLIEKREYRIDEDEVAIEISFKKLFKSMFIDYLGESFKTIFSELGWTPPGPEIFGAKAFKITIRPHKMIA